MHVEGSARAVVHRYPRFLLGLTPLLAALAGCSSGVHVVPLTPAEQELANLVAACMDAEEKLSRPPKSAEELKPFLQRFGDPKDLLTLTSPNDGEPYTVVWGAALVGGPTDYEGMFPIIAYERKGKGGKRAVVDVRGRPLTVPQGDFSRLTFVRGHKPSPD